MLPSNPKNTYYSTIRNYTAVFGFGAIFGSGIAYCWFTRRCYKEKDCLRRAISGGERPREGGERLPPQLPKDPSSRFDSIDLPEFPPTGILVGIDIGGTLSKIAVCCSDSKQAQNLRNFIEKSDTYGKTGKRDTKADFMFEDKRIMFLTYETARTSNAIDIMRRENLIEPGTAIGCTGGGAFRYNKEFQKQLRCGWRKVDEMLALVTGISFLIQKVPQSIYTFPHFAEDAEPKKQYLDVGVADRYPRMIVNVGSGVSILLMESANEFKRVGGSSLGGATFFGLAKLISGCTSFEEALSLARRGDSKKVDLLVGDIYGGHYCELGLSADVIAAYFGKLARCDSTEVEREDLMAALLKLITYSIGSTAFLYAKIYNPKKIIFTGNFLRGNVDAEARIAFMVRRMSEGNTEALFLERVGYYGSLGALLGAAPIRARLSSLSIFSIDDGCRETPQSLVLPASKISPKQALLFDNDQVEEDEEKKEHDDKCI